MEFIMMPVAVGSFFVTLSLILSLCPVARMFNLTDQPCSRKNHSGEIPLIGGLCIYICLLILSFWLPININAYLFAATLITLCGIFDDYKDISFKIRLAVECLAALIMIYYGNVQITSLGNILGTGVIELGYFSTIFTVFAVVGGINAFNMIDGIDGLAGSLSLITFVLLLFVGFSIPVILILCTLFIFAISAFLLFNMRIFGRKKASVFLGDTGSMLIGFTISYLIILASQGENKIISPVIVLWIIALPLFDSISIMLRRIQKGKSPFAPDREHFHHILPLAGYSINQTVVIIISSAFILGSFGLIGDRLLHLPEWFLFSVFLCQFALYYWGMCHAWQTMKIARYIREFGNDRRKSKERRKLEMAFEKERRVADQERRSGIDRRYHRIESDIEGMKKKRNNSFIQLFLKKT